MEYVLSGFLVVLIISILNMRIVVKKGREKGERVDSDRLLNAGIQWIVGYVVIMILLIFWEVGVGFTQEIESEDRVELKEMETSVYIKKGEVNCENTEYECNKDGFEFYKINNGESIDMLMVKRDKVEVNKVENDGEAYVTIVKKRYKTKIIDKIIGDGLNTREYKYTLTIPKDSTIGVFNVIVD